MDIFSIVVAGVGVSIVVFVAVWIVLEKRQATSTLAWLFAIIILPYMGIALYLILGRQRMKRKAFEKEYLRKKCLSALGSLENSLREEELRLHRIFSHAEPMLRLSCIQSDLPITANNKATLLRDHSETYPAIFKAIEEAKECVHVLFYIIKQDSTGEKLAQILIKKAQQGLRVRLIYDDFGSIGLKKAWLKKMRDAGVEIAVFLPLLVPFAWARMRWSFRNHRKIVVVDDRIAFTGGLNIGEEYEGKNPKIGHWRDSFVRIEGPAAVTLNLVFLEDWHYLTHELLEHKPLESGSGTSLVNIVASGPDRDWEEMLIQFFVAISTARRLCYITTPYFIPNAPIKLALISSAMRGVDVRLLLPGKSDNKILALASRSYYEELLESGVKIYEYERGFLHAKTICVDDIYASVGSANMDPRSLRTNFEVNAFIYDEAFASQVREVFLDDLKDSREIFIEDELRESIFKRILVSSARILSPIL